MYSKKGLVDKLHAGWFIDRTPVFLLNQKVFSVEILQKEGKV